MSRITTDRRLKRIGLATFVAIATAASAAAQTNRTEPDNRDSRLKPGTTVWVTDANGREERGRIVGVTPEIMTTSTADGTREFRFADVARIEARHNDSVLNGAVIGAGAAVVTGLLLCNLTEPWENCRDDVGPMLRIGALGAGVGIAVDALFRGRKTVYETSSGSVRLHAAPLVARRGGGVRVTLAF